MNGFLPIGDPSTWGREQIVQLINNIVNVLLGLGGAIAVLFIIWGAYQYLTAFGDEAKAEEGKKTITWAILGIIFIIVSRLLVLYVWHLVSPEIPTGSTPGTYDFPEPRLP